MTILLSAICQCLLSQNLWAFAVRPADGTKLAVSLSGHLSIFYDPTGILSIDEVASQREGIIFTPIPSMLTEGYRRGAVWVHFSLSAPEGPETRLLQIERPLIEQVTLYAPDGQGHLTATPPGEIDPWNDRDARAYPSIFPILILPAERGYYLRLQSSTSITTALNLWKSDGYERYIRNGNWLIGIVIGAIGAMIITNILYYAWLYDNIYLLYASFLLISGLMTSFHMGYASQIFYFLKPHQIYRSWGIIVCLYSVVLVLFLGQLFELRRHWAWAWWSVLAFALLNAVALIFAMAGRYGEVGFFVSRLQQVSSTFIALLALYLSFWRQMYRYLLATLAFGSVLIILLVMQMQYTGANPFQIDGSLARVLAVGTLVHTVLLSAAVAKRAQLAERSLRQEKDRVIAISQAAERDLTIKVRARTAELAESNVSLKAEMDHRHQLEVKLRQSLDSVNDALSQQRDFLALVSHEFRGPLAVITAAADNLQLTAAESDGDVRTRTSRIRQTVKRMTLLIENVLARDRLDAESLHAQVGMFDLNEILPIAQAGLDDDAAGRVAFAPGREARVKGDRYLLEVALQNLIQNALKYSPPPRAVIVRLSVDQGMALIRVIDQGPGVPPEERAFIFLKYYRATGQRVNGSGLGLYIAREIARQHGGELSLEASDAAGSTFCLSLPLESQPSGDSLR